MIMNDYRAYVENDYNSIYHFGILGMKWGIRRYQNPDGTFTEEGRKRYGKIYDRMKQQGYSDKEISDYIVKRNKILKGIAIGTATAAGVAGAYYLNKHFGGGKYFDKTIKAGQTIKTLKVNPDEIKKGHFYSSSSKKDHNRYIARFGIDSKLDDDFKIVDTLKKSVEQKALKNVKIASEQNQFKTFDELMNKNENFKSGFIKNIKPFKDYAIVLDKPDIRKGNELIKRLKNGSVDYKNLNIRDKKLVSVFFNTKMVDHTSMPNEQKAFFEALSKRGYGGMADSLDGSRGTLRAKTANIIFDNKSFVQTKITDLTMDDIDKALSKDILNKNAETKISDIVSKVPIIFPALGYSSVKLQDYNVTHTRNKKD